MILQLRYYILLLCLVGMNSPALYSQWERTAGPSKADIRQTIVVNDSTLLALANKGIYRSTDNGLHWHLTYNERPQTIGSIGTTLLTGIRQDGLLASHDNGETWKKVQSESTYYYPTFFLTKGSRIFSALSNEGCFYSNDTGKTWTHITGIPRKPLAGAVIGNTLVVAFVPDQSEHTIFTSSDNGETWQPVVLKDFKCYSLCAVGSQLFAGGHGSVLRSDDNGQHWTKLNSGLPAQDIISIHQFGQFHEKRSVYLINTPVWTVH